MGQSTPKNEARNQALYNDWKSGLRGQPLAKKYDISTQRCGQIVERERFFEVVPSLENDNE
jgi:Mor family transcriptional regulator